ncbi:MAG: methyltransferase domain-containing protein [Phycisphaerae bacterium]|nr:methyltransferase domain-containing protein [Phycisphaerae bacterium]
MDNGAPGAPPVQARCRSCGTPLHHTFVDLGMSPLCESFRTAEQLNQMEPFYPLHVRVCERCFLVQLEEYVKPEDIFTEYAYFSSYSDSWLRHAGRYVDMIAQRLALDKTSQVIELASNDGYLLQYFVAKGIPALGIEPAANVAEAAVKKGVPTRVAFFGRSTAEALAAEGVQADLIIGNNVLAQVPDLNDFVGGMPLVLKPNGVITLEFPHLVRLVEGNQLDTIYHEHFSYFSLMTTDTIFARHGLRLFDVEELPTHGGSLRIYACHEACPVHPASDRLQTTRDDEIARGVNRMDYYSTFSEQAKETKRKLLDFLIRARREGHRIAGYGAPGKGNTLLNYCGIRTDFLEYTVDRNPYKQGRFLPGTRVPIYHPDRIAETRPDYVLILPWNLREEIMKQLAYVREWGAKFVVPIPEVAVYS